MTLAPAEAAQLRAAGIRFFVSTGPFHSHLIQPSSTLAFARELRSLHLVVAYRHFSQRVGEWTDQVDTGIDWAFAR